MDSVVGGKMCSLNGDRGDHIHSISNKHAYASSSLPNLFLLKQRQISQQNQEIDEAGDFFKHLGTKTNLNANSSTTEAKKKGNETKFNPETLFTNCLQVVGCLRNDFSRRSINNPAEGKIKAATETLADLHHQTNSKKLKPNVDQDKWQVIPCNCEKGTKKLKFTPLWQSDLFEKKILFHNSDQTLQHLFKKEGKRDFKVNPAISYEPRVSNCTLTIEKLDRGLVSSEDEENVSHNELRDRNDEDDFSENNSNECYYSSSYSSLSFESLDSKVNNVNVKEQSTANEDESASTESDSERFASIISRQPILLEYLDEADANETKQLLICADEIYCSIFSGKKIFSSDEIFDQLSQISMKYKRTALRIVFKNKREDYSKSILAADFAAPKESINVFSEQNNQKEKKVSKSTSFGVTTPDKGKLVPVFGSEGSSFTRRLNCSSSSHEVSAFRDIKRKVTYQLSDNKTRDSNDFNRRRFQNILKRVNSEEVITSEFRSFFHFYAKLGGRLKSGAVISKKNSNIWLKRAGIVSDDYSEATANDCFDAIARSKLVLNISDYVQYLIVLARRWEMLISELLQQLMNNSTGLTTNLKVASLHGNDATGANTPSMLLRQVWKSQKEKGAR